MATDEHITPEKQLLKLIEDPTSEKIKTEAAKRQKKKLFSFAALKGRLAFWKSFTIGRRPASGTPTMSFGMPAFGFQQVNIFLRISILFLSLYLGYSVVAMGIELKKSASLIFQPEKALPMESKEVPAMASLSNYLDKVVRRDMFRLPQNTVPKEAWTPPSEEPSAKELLSKRLSLVGIAWSDRPEAMIEDADLNRTHFVKQGDSFADSIQVVAVFKDRIVLRYKDVEIELR